MIYIIYETWEGIVYDAGYFTDYQEAVDVADVLVLKGELCTYCIKTLKKGRR